MKNNNLITSAITSIMSMDIPDKDKAVLIERLLQSQQTTQAPTPAPAQKTEIFMKYNTETGERDIEVPCTPAQKAAWEKRASRTYKSKEELQAITDAFKWTKALDKAIKDNPAISNKQIHALGGKGCTRDMLAQRKVELGVR